jgi:YggT family protein
MDILLSNFLHGLAVALGIVLDAFVFLLIARAVISWVSPDPRNPIVQFIHGATEPLISRVRQKVPPLGMFDMSVIIVLIVLYFLKAFVVGSLEGYSRRLGNDLLMFFM